MSIAGSGCALVNGTTQSVPIVSNIPGTEVFVDDVLVGTTKSYGPIVVDLKRKRGHIIEGRKEGYVPQYVKLEQTNTDLGVIDSLGMFIFIVPAISILTGSAFELEPDFVLLELDPAKSN